MFWSKCSNKKKEIFESFKLQERRDVSYYFPENYSEDKKYPLIVVLDADYLFELVVSNAKFFSKYNRMPESIIVGVHQEDLSGSLRVLSPGCMLRRLCDAFFRSLGCDALRRSWCMFVACDAN